MNLQAEIKWIQKELQMVKDPTFIEAIKNMLLYRKKVSESGRISIEQYNKEIDEAIQRVEQGEFYTQKEVDKIINKWLE
jgi:hypothetical protein